MTTDEKLKEILEKDYYVPDVSELCIGFEYSYRADNNIVHRVIEGLYDYEQAFIKFLEEDNLFVKKLDVHDIESLGFKDITILPDNEMYFFTNNNLNLSLDKDNVIIVKDIDVVFRGIIKNKSELKKLFKQLTLDEK